MVPSQTRSHVHMAELYRDNENKKSETFDALIGGRWGESINIETAPNKPKEYFE